MTTKPNKPSSQWASAASGCGEAASAEEQALRKLLPCVADDCCAYDHTCTNHRLRATVIANIERQARTEGVKKGEARTLAQVVAAINPILDWAKEHDVSPGDAVQDVLDALDELEPASYSLNKLLRLARLDEAKWWEHLVSADNPDHPEGFLEGCMYCERIAKLERKGKGEEANG